MARDVLLQAMYEGFPPMDAYPSSDRWKIEEMRKKLPLRNELVASAKLDRA